MSIVKKTPMAISCIALSLAALGNLMLPYGEWVRYLCGTLLVLILILFVLKLMLDVENVKRELKNPVVLSVMPTATMAVMLLCTYVKPFIGAAAIALWYAALVMQILIMLLFVKRFVVRFSIKTVFPSWFVTGVGIVVASITSPAMNIKAVGQIAFYIGFVLYFMMLPLVVYRMVKAKPIPEPALPTTAIFTAPMSLCLAGYMSVFEQPNAVLVYVMLAVCVISYLYVTVRMISLLKLKFYPTYAAFTFPYVISAVAFKSANAFLVKNGYTFFSFAPKFSEYMAIAVVIYVIVRYAAFITCTREQT